MADLSSTQTASPTVSILVTTFNRKHLLKKCLDRILAQTWRDLEVIVIDDCSSDGTEQFMATYTDPRIRYVRNTQNMGAAHGDRTHIQRFVHELSRGRYFGYVCDDDYWISTTLLARQMALFEAHPNAVMVTGGQFSYFLEDDEESPLIGEENLSDYLDAKYHSSNPDKFAFFKDVFPASHMSSDAFLSHFAEHPTACNIIVGATLYNKELFIRSGALQTNAGSKWQAGYELFMGPGCYGEFVYMDEPCILTEIRRKNASFNRTQHEHYMDSLVSIERAFEKPLQDWANTPREAMLKQLIATSVENLSRTYISNTLSIKRFGRLGMCTKENMAVPVSCWTVLRTRLKHGARIPGRDIAPLLLIALPEPVLRWGTHYYHHYKYRIPLPANELLIRPLEQLWRAIKNDRVNG